MSSAYLRLLIFLPAILTSACVSSSLVFLMMYSAYKLNKHGDNIQPWCTPSPIWNQSVVPCPVLTITDTLPNKIHRWQISMWKFSSHRMSSSISTIMIYHYLFEWSNLRILVTPMLIKMWSSRNSHTLLIGMKNSSVPLEDSLVACFKMKYTLTIQFSNHTLWQLPKGVKMSTQKPSHRCLQQFCS